MIEKLLVAFVLGILKFLAQRADTTNAAKAEVYYDLFARTKKAYQFEVDAASRPDGGANLRVREGGGEVKLSSGDANSDGGSTGTQV